jgi:hypothetical protein
MTCRVSTLGTFSSTILHRDPQSPIHSAQLRALQAAHARAEKTRVRFFDIS